MKRLIAFLFLFSLWFTTYSQDNSTNPPDVASGKTAGIELTGFVRGLVYGGAKAFDYSSVFGETCFRTELSKGHTSFYSDLRIRSGLFFEERSTRIQVKEAWAAWKSAKLDFILGNQIVSWGRTDGFNPTNNITPNDYFFLTPDPDDQKLSNFMIRMKLRPSPETEAELIIAPVYLPSVYRYDLFNLGNNVKFTDPVLPGKSFGNGSLAARFNAEYPGIGFSVSWFSGYDPFHGYDIQKKGWSSGYPEITNAARPYRKNTLGADMVLPFSSFIWRSEAAFDFNEKSNGRMYVPKPALSMVTALEYNGGSWNLILQYVGKFITGFVPLATPVLTDPANPLALMSYAEDLIRYESALFNRKIFNAQKKTNHALMLSINRLFLHETCQLETTAYFNLTSHDYFIRPKITWKPADALSVSAGGNWLDGPEKSVFGYSNPVLSGFFLELKASF